MKFKNLLRIIARLEYRRLFEPLTFPYSISTNSLPPHRSSILYPRFLEALFKCQFVVKVSYFLMNGRNTYCFMNVITDCLYFCSPHPNWLPVVVFLWRAWNLGLIFAASFSTQVKIGLFFKCLNSSIIILSCCCRKCLGCSNKHVFHAGRNNRRCIHGSRWAAEFMQWPRWESSQYGMQHARCSHPSLFSSWFTTNQGMFFYIFYSAWNVMQSKGKTLF